MNHENSGYKVRFITSISFKMIIRNQVMKTLEASSLNSRGSERPMVACHGFGRTKLSMTWLEAIPARNSDRLTRVSVTLAQP